MRDFIRHFVREHDGSWRCTEPTELNLPSGRIQFAPGACFRHGVPYMGVDVCALLEEQEKRATS